MAAVLETAPGFLVEGGKERGNDLRLYPLYFSGHLSTNSFDFINTRRSPGAADGGSRKSIEDDQGLRLTGSQDRIPHKSLYTSQQLGMGTDLT